MELNNIDESFIEKTLPLLSNERRLKVQKMRNTQRRKLSITAYLLLRFALYEEYGINEPVDFTYGEKGKPELRDHPYIRFNLSHCKNAVACVLSDKETGVDIQDIRPVTDNVAKRVLTAEEYEAFSVSRDPNRYFCELWAVKECYLKKTGQGINMDLSKLSADSVDDIIIYRDSEYICCTGGKDTKLRNISMCELYSFLNKK